MKIVIITQNEPFYLYDNIEYFLKILPVHSNVIGCVVNDVSPFGKKESFFTKAKKTFDIFGLSFFMYYTWKFIKNKLSSQKDIRVLLERLSIPEITLDEHINHEDSIRKIKTFHPDLLISILGNQIFKAPIINLAPKGCLNLHTALLPKYRGLMPSFWVMKNDEKYTGVSVFFVDEGIDSGQIIIQKRIEIGDRTLEELIIHTKKIGMDAIAEAVDMIERNEIRLIDNDAKRMTYYSFPTRKDVKEFLAKGKKFF